jgi:CheY-like chemotaxis protein
MPNPQALNMRILAADDHPTNRLVIETLMSPLASIITVVKDGAEAVAASEAAPYDVVLMDLHMPVMDGYQATRAIRQSGGQNASIPIIAVSADDTESSMKACREAGISSFCVKPVTVEKLIAAIERAYETPMNIRPNDSDVEFFD